MYQRVRTMLAYLYDNHLDDYDYFNICGDDTYIMVENLKEFVASKRGQEWDAVPGQYLFAGFWSKTLDNQNSENKHPFYLNGGSGYTISRKALKAYVEGSLQSCLTHHEGSAEDLFLSMNVRNITDKFIYTADSSGAHRYHPAPVHNHFGMPRMKLTLRMLEQPPYNIKQHWGKHEYTSNSSITFHRHYHATELKRLELLLYKDYAKECKQFLEDAIYILKGMKLFQMWNTSHTTTWLMPCTSIGMIHDNVK